MASGPDLRFDIDALFQHLARNLHEEPLAERQWNFHLTADDPADLEAVGDELADEFQVEMPEVVEIGEDGEETPGRPLLMLVRIGALGPDEIKAIAARVAALAEENGFTYEGVACHEPADWEELEAWMPLDDARWRLRSITDSGLPEGEPLGWVFALRGDRVALERLADAIDWADAIPPDLSDEDGVWTLVVGRVATNDEPAFAVEFARIEALAAEHEVELLGAQFFDPDAEPDDDD